MGRFGVTCTDGCLRNNSTFSIKVFIKTLSNYCKKETKILNKKRFATTSNINEYKQKRQ